MARVNKMKGLDWIFELAEAIEEQHLQDRISITFYGPILEDDKSYFEENVSRFSFVEYKGILEPKDIHESLSNYDVMLLPIHSIPRDSRVLSWMPIFQVFLLL